MGSPRVFLIMDNEGGRIFEQLPIANHLEKNRELFDKLWLTKAEIDFESAAHTYGLEYRKAETPQQLAQHLNTAFANTANKAFVIHAQVRPNSAMEEQALMIRTLGETGSTEEEMQP